MKMSKAEKKEMAEPAAPGSREDYPYGLCIRLGKEELEKLGLSKFPEIGQVFTIEAKSVVKSLSASAGESGSYASVELQITDMDLEPDASDKKAKTAKLLFTKMGDK